MEGDYDPSPDGAPLVLFGLPSNAEGRVNYKVEAPKVGSLILKHHPNAPLPGLKDFPRDQWAPVPIFFWSFLIMVALGFGMLGLGLFCLFARSRQNMSDVSWLFRAECGTGPEVYVSVHAGQATH